MSLRTFTTVQDLVDSGLEYPFDLVEIAQEQEDRGEPWDLYHFQPEGSETEVWTLVLKEDGRALQWQDGERVSGSWGRERRVLRADEGEGAELFDLEGRRVPEDPWEETEEEGWGEDGQADPSTL